MTEHPTPPFPDAKQPMPGTTDRMDPQPDHGEATYRGAGLLSGKVALITGGDSGIGRAVALAYAREGADVAIAYLPEEQEDAAETVRLVEREGRRCLCLPGDIGDADHARGIVAQTVESLGKLDILVNNAAHQAEFDRAEDIADDEWEATFRTNVHGMFYLTKAALPHLEGGGCIINTTSINADRPSPGLLAYATTKGAIHNFTAGLAQMVAGRGIRVNCVAPGPVWTPLIPSTLSPGKVESFGKQVPMQRPAQPAELATAYVMLADPRSSYTTGATVAVTGGAPFL